jgi:hypothetical protein
MAGATRGGRGRPPRRMEGIMSDGDPGCGKRVRHYRQILLWPLQLMPIREGSQIQRHWEVLEQGGDDNPWHEIEDEFTGEPEAFQTRHYNEFVTFLPYVQRFLYGEARSKRKDARGEHAAASPMRVYRRDDICAVRLVVRPGDPPRTLAIAHVDLYFFFDIDVVLLNVEVRADDLPLTDAEDMLYRFGRAYPAGWDDEGQGLHCMHRTEWLGHDGSVLAASDASEREKFLSFVCRHRAPRISAHWAFLLRPLVLDHAEERGPIRYRQLEYYRMPMMAYLALDDPRALTRSDFIRLGLVTAPGGDEPLPYSDRHVADFEQRYCLDRFWSDGVEGLSTRYMCCGHALVVVGDGRSAFFVGAESGVLAQFRHQHFLLFLIAHFQKAALLMFASRLVNALMGLEVGDPESVKRFKRAIRQNFEIFLRFTHRYWFHEVADQAQAKALFHLVAEHLGVDPLYVEVKERMYDMMEYLDSDSLRRQANTVVRLTVVTTFGMIGTITTGYFGMNILAADLLGAGDYSFAWKLAFFIGILLGTIVLLVLTVARSKRLSDFLDALSDDRLSWKAKAVAFWRVFMSEKPASARRHETAPT